MNGEMALYIGQRALQTALLVALPVLSATLIVGFLVSIFQAVTSIRDMTIALVVKMATVAVTLLICAGWMMRLTINLTLEMFAHMQGVAQ